MRRVSQLLHLPLHGAVQVMLMGKAHSLYCCASQQGPAKSMPRLWQSLIGLDCKCRLCVLGAVQGGARCGHGEVPQYLCQPGSAPLRHVRADAIQGTASQIFSPTRHVCTRMHQNSICSHIKPMVSKVVSKQAFTCVLLLCCSALS